jgi:hypothetical protein
MPEVRKFDSRLGHWVFNWPNASSSTMVLGSTQPPTEMSTANLHAGKGQPEGKTEASPPSMSRLYKIGEASTCNNPVGLHGMLQG